MLGVIHLFFTGRVNIRLQGSSGLVLRVMSGLGKVYTGDMPTHIFFKKALDCEEPHSK